MLFLEDADGDGKGDMLEVIERMMKFVRDQTVDDTWQSICRDPAVLSDS